jgi:glycosyltransferase involved in cell wall biosynthesis
MRILHIYKDYYPVLGGIENHIRTLAEAQARRGHSVSVLVTSRDARTHIDELNGVRVIFAGRLATLASTPLSLAFLGQLRGERPDIAHLHYPYPPGDVAQTWFGRSRATIITYHSDIVRQKGLLRFYAPLLRHSLARADRIIATSPRYVETSPFLSPHAARCAIVPYGIETAPFEAVDPARVAAIRAQHPGPLILFVGQLRYYKGVEYLIRAMPQVQARALIIGSETTTRLNELRALVTSLGVEDKVAFLGEQSDELPAYYHACDVFVLPSVERSEAFGIVQVEAMTAGRPVISTEVGTGTSWINQHEITGLVVPPRNEAALAAALQRLLADDALRARLGAAGQARILSQFTTAHMLAGVEAVYASLAG